MYYVKINVLPQNFKITPLWGKCEHFPVPGMVRLFLDVGNFPSVGIWIGNSIDYKHARSLERGPNIAPYFTCSHLPLPYSVGSEKVHIFGGMSGPVA